jgi:hypothetical protein
MASGIAHERERFESMTVRQLNTRLNRITKTDKLLDFAKMAREFGYSSLERKAIRKFEQKTGATYNVDTRQWYREPVERAEPRKKRREAPSKSVKKKEEDTGIIGAYPLM